MSNTKINNAIIKYLNDYSPTTYVAPRKGGHIYLMALGLVNKPSMTPWKDGYEQHLDRMVKEGIIRKFKTKIESKLELMPDYQLPKNNC